MMNSLNINLFFIVLGLVQSHNIASAGESSLLKITWYDISYIRYNSAENDDFLKQ